MAAKVCPEAAASSASAGGGAGNGCCCYTSSSRETFTIWMKSLVLHGNGCTVFDSSGQIVYRIDNYGHKSSDEVYLMDLQGEVLFSIQRKKVLGVLGRWDGYRGSGSTGKEEKPWFQVKRNCKIMNLRGDSTTCLVTLYGGKTEGSYYKIVGMEGQSALKITDHHGQIIAQVKQKQSSSGVVLGEDVLSLVVEPLVDNSVIMALVTAYSLIHHKL